MTRIDHQTLGEWQRSLASSSPTPGVVPAAAVALGQGCALGLMVCDLTLSNERYSNGWPAAEAFSESAVPVLFTSLELASKDVVAYDAVVDAMALPKDTEEDRATRGIDCGKPHEGPLRSRRRSQTTPQDCSSTWSPWLKVAIRIRSRTLVWRVSC